MSIWIRVIVALMLACLPALAEEEEMEFDIDIATTLTCDTRHQVERFVSLFDGDVRTALLAVNAEYNSSACDVVRIAYVPGDEVSIVRGPCGQFQVVKILLVGVFTEEGFFFTAPAPYFAMLPVSAAALESVTLSAKDCPPIFEPSQYRPR